MTIASIILIGFILIGYFYFIIIKSLNYNKPKSKNNLTKEDKNLLKDIKFLEKNKQKRLEENKFRFLDI